MSQNSTQPPVKSLNVSSSDGPEIPTDAVALACQSCDAGGSLVAKGLCCRDFRSTLGRFATGVTVITALSPDGKPIGVTISSFNSVSLDPPLILWSLSLNSPNLEALSKANHYSVNILSADQWYLSDRFASSCSDRFANIPLRAGLSGIPLLEGCCAWFECTNEAHYPGGDHLIFIGHVERFSAGEAESPLLFHNGCYRQLDSKK